MIALRCVRLEMVKVDEHSRGSTFVLFVTKGCGVETNSMGWNLFLSE